MTPPVRVERWVGLGVTEVVEVGEESDEGERDKRRGRWCFLVLERFAISIVTLLVTGSRLDPGVDPAIALVIVGGSGDDRRFV